MGRWRRRAAGGVGWLWCAVPLPHDTFGAAGPLTIGLPKEDLACLSRLQRGDARLERAHGSRARPAMSFTASNSSRLTKSTPPKLPEALARTVTRFAGHSGEGPGGRVGQLDEIAIQGFRSASRLLWRRGRFGQRIRSHEGLKLDPLPALETVRAVRIRVEAQELIVERGRKQDPRQVGHQQQRSVRRTFQNSTM